MQCGVDPQLAIDLMQRVQKHNNPTLQTAGGPMLDGHVAATGHGAPGYHTPSGLGTTVPKPLDQEEPAPKRQKKEKEKVKAR